MKIHQITSGLPLAITNEENNFIKKYKDSVKITALNEHDTWIAQNLVRKGVYDVDDDHNTLVKR